MRRLPEAYIDNRILNSGLHLPSASLRSSMVLVSSSPEHDGFPCLFLRFLGVVRGDLATPFPAEIAMRTVFEISQHRSSCTLDERARKEGEEKIARVEQSFLFSAVPCRKLTRLATSGLELQA